MNQIKQDYVLFVDEFEKLFSTSTVNEKEGYHNQEVFLSFMDGVLTNEHKVLFLLTSNDGVNQFFINRPSRIKFMVEYDELPEELFNLIVDDKLINKEFKQDLEENVSLVNLNIDLLISIVDDINLFNKPFSTFSKLYNYKFESYKYELYRIVGEVESFKNFFNNSKRIKYNDTYICGYEVDQMLKFTKEEIIFETSIWEEDKKGKDIKINCKIKLVPSKSFGTFNNMVM